MAHLLQEEAHTDVTSLRNERLVPKEIRGGPSPASTTVRSEVEKVSTREDSELREHFGLHLLRLVEEEEEEDGPEKTRLDARLPALSDRLEAAVAVCRREFHRVALIGTRLRPSEDSDHDVPESVEPPSKTGDWQFGPTTGIVLVGTASTGKPNFPRNVGYAKCCGEFAAGTWEVFRRAAGALPRWNESIPHSWSEFRGGGRPEPLLLRSLPKRAPRARTPPLRLPCSRSVVSSVRSSPT